MFTKKAKSNVAQQPTANIERQIHTRSEQLDNFNKANEIATKRTDKTVARSYTKY